MRRRQSSLVNRKRGVALCSVCTVFLSCIVLLVSLGFFCGRERFLDRTIKGSTTLTQEWTEITLEKPLKPERDVQAIILYLEEPYLADLRMDGVIMPDGSRVKPEVQLVDLAGNTSTLAYDGLFGQKLVMFSLRDELKHGEYRMVRVRSEKSIRLKEIFWRCYYTRDID